MKISYTVIETKENDGTNEPYIGYGLRCVCGAESAEVKNISPGRESVRRLAELLEREAVEPMHLFDVIYDILSEGLVV